MIKYLVQPYPLTIGIKRIFLFNLTLGLFIAFFLLIFQPFGISIWVTNYKTLKLLGYGFVSFLMPTLVFFILRITQINTDEENWTTGKEVIWVMNILIFIALGNIYYSYLLGISNLTIKGFFDSLISVIVIGIFPVMVNVFLKYNRYLKLNTKEASEIGVAISQYNLTHINHHDNSNLDDNIELLAENNKNNLSIKPTDILYLESADNYTQIVYHKDQQINKELLRGSLTRFEQQIQQSNIVRCHRSFVVNLTKVSDISGNAQGYKLTLSDSDKLIPVARNYGKDILTLLKK